MTAQGNALGNGQPYLQSSAARRDGGGYRLAASGDFLAKIGRWRASSSHAKIVDFQNRALGGGAGCAGWRAGSRAAAAAEG